MIQVGDTTVWERTFTPEDVQSFTQLSGDAGVHHLEPDASGRLLVHGLLTATLPTKIGGEMNYIAREMLFRFHRPVFTGDNVRCEVTITGLEPAGKTVKLAATWVCTNQRGEIVMTGETFGVIRN